MTSPFLSGVTYTVSVTGLAGDDGLSIIVPETASLRYTPVVSYAAQIQPVFDASCAFVGCHSADLQFPPGSGLVLDPSASYLNLVNVPSDQVSGATRVSPGNSDASYLVGKLTGLGITGDQMPLLVGPTWLPPKSRFLNCG
jgi:hypothetical protein